MSLLPLALAGSLGAWLLMERSSKAGVDVSSGSVSIVPGELYRFTYATQSPLALAEATVLVTPFQVSALTLENGANGYRLLSFTGRAKKAATATIGAALLAARPDISLVRVRRYV